MNPRAGFTLIELSIVLVIIGLITAAVLVGRELVEAAALRQQIAQVQQFGTAVNTFKAKYGGLPGDLRAADATGFGMAARSGAAGHGDGNGTIDGCDPHFPSYEQYGCEGALFWSDLSFAGLLAANFSAANSAADTFLDVSADQMDAYFPKAALGNQAYFAVFTGYLPGLPVAHACADHVCAALATIRGVSGAPLVGVYQLANDSGEAGGVTPRQAFAIDNKMDDGSPLSGTVTGGYTDEDSNVLLLRFDAGSYSDNACLFVAGAGALVSDYSYATGGNHADQSACAMNFVVN